MKSIIEHHQSIEVRDLVMNLTKLTDEPLVANDGYYAEYIYTLTNPYHTSPKSYKVLLDSTTPNYGGYRYWLVCEGCHRKITALYISNGQLACRHCLDLEYGSRIFAHNEQLLEFCNYQRGMKTLTRRHSYGEQTTRAGRMFKRYMGSLLEKYPAESLIHL